MQVSTCGEQCIQKLILSLIFIIIVIGINFGLAENIRAELLVGIQQCVVLQLITSSLISDHKRWILFAYLHNSLTVYMLVYAGCVHWLCCYPFFTVTSGMAMSTL